MSKKPRLFRLSLFRVFVLLCALAVVVGVCWFATRKTEEQYRLACEQLADDENWAELRIEARAWQGHTDRPDEALTFLAEAEFQSGNPEQAVKHLLAIPPLSERSFPALIAACDLQFGEMNRPLDGVKTLKRMIESRPESITSRRRLIFFYAVTLQRELMLDAIREAIRAKAEPPDAYVYLLLAQKLGFSNGFAKNSEWLKSNPDSELFQVARIIQLLDSIESSENPARKAALPEYRKVFEELRRKFPTNTRLITYEIEAAADEFDLEKVERLLRLVSSGSNDSAILRWRGWLEMQQDSYEEAEKLLKQSIGQFRLDWQTWHELSACHRRLGNLDAAARAEQIALIGKELQKEVLQLKDAASIEAKTLEKLASYAASCGDDEISLAILLRLRSGQVPN